jgi:hypothetical protein
MKNVVLFAILLSLTATSYAQLWEGDLLGIEGELHGSVGITYDTKYIWRGIDIYNDNTAIHAYFDLDLYQTGFGISSTAHRANTSGFENGERWDHMIYYQNGIYPDEPYAVNYRLGYVYYNFPDHNSRWYDMQEMHLILNFPNALPVEGLVPSYVLVYLSPAYANSLVEHLVLPGQTNASGFAHIFMLDYAFTIQGILPEVPEQLIKLHSEVVFNDGVDPRGLNVDQDWTNAVFGVSTDFDLGYNITFTPGLYYQRTMDKTINPDEDEFWASLTLRYSF